MSFAFLSSVLVFTGCRQKESAPEPLKLEGRIEQIKPRSDTTGEISVSYYLERRREEAVGTGLVTEETEITVNGEPATLADLNVGDRFRGEVWIEVRNGKRQQIARKIHVERPTVEDE